MSAMNKIIIIRIVILSVFVLSYLIFTILNFRELRKSIIFTRWVKVFHLVMIWIIPFAWVLFLKALSKSAPGSYEVEQKADPAPFSGDGGTMWTG